VWVRTLKMLMIGLSLIGLVASKALSQPVTEDCIGFQATNLKIKLFNNRWKIVDGNHWILDFGGNKAEADKALWVITTYGYDQQCFIGRPGPSMTYWKRKPSSKNATTVFIVRHAEKGTTPPDNPPLTPQGENRAKTLAQILAQAGVSAIYSTDFTRTQETVNNTAAQLGLPVQLYDTTNQLTNLIKTGHQGKTVLVAGHSDTVPQILSSLGIESPSSIGNEFNNLFVVVLHPDGRATLSHLKYEVHSNLNTFQRFR
jgi:broad specificity phosphatase PhoE